MRFPNLIFSTNKIISQTYDVLQNAYVESQSGSEEDDVPSLEEITL